MFVFPKVDLKYFILFIFIVFTINFGFTSVYSTNHVISVELDETVSEVGFYDSVTGFNVNNLVSGKIIVKNVNPTETVSDIYVFFDNSSNVLNATYLSGISGEIVNWNSNSFGLHISQLRPGNVSVWNYSISSSISSPLNFSTSYSVGKVLTGEVFRITDVVSNEFNNASYQQNTCIYDIKLKQTTRYAGNSSFDRFLFLPATTGGTDSGNVAYSGANSVQDWNVLSGGCLNKGLNRNIFYNVSTPSSILGNKNYNISESVLSFKLNETISHLRVKSIEAVGDANLTLSKKILKPSHPTLYGTNVTWQVNGSFETDSSLSYTLKRSTFWVSRRNVDGLYTNLSKVDVDGISGSNLVTSFSPNYVVNSTQFWYSSNWLFNYSDVPSPITWFNVSFTVANDGIQLGNKSLSNSGNSTYYKQIVIISGYLLEISKNVTSVGVDKYNVKINVFNKGSQITPSGSIVTVYDFVPDNFILSSGFVYSSSPWYSTTGANNSVSGTLEGDLQQWALVPNNGLNSSFDKGPIKTNTNSWSVEYNITGQGDYQNLDVFITGLDPQAVEGAGAASSIVINDHFFELDLLETLFAVVSGILVFVIFLL